MSTPRTISLIVALGTLSLVGLGCSSPSDAVKANVEQKASNAAVEGMVDAASGGKVKLDSQGKTGTFTDSRTGVTAAYGAGVKLPSNFPSDVPMPGNSTVMLASVDTVQHEAQVEFKSTDDAATVESFYETSLTAAGWTKGQTTNSPIGQLATYTKANATISVTVIAGQDPNDKSTMVSVTRAEAAAETK